MSGGLQGHLHLTGALDPRGRTYLRHQSFSVPMHISKPHEESGVLVVNVINPTAGWLSGDRVQCRVEVEGGARLLLTCPSAARSHRMVHGHAELTQEFHVAAGGSLDVWPELFIPQAGTRYRQRTVAQVDTGGELLLAEMLAPGRTAFGESFRYERLCWEIDLFNAGQLIARERATLEPGSPNLEALRALFPEAYYASIFIISPHLSEASACWSEIHALHHIAAWVGVSRLCRDGWIVKMVAQSSIHLRSALTAARTALFASLPRPQPDLRRT